MKRFFAYSIVALLSLCASCMSTESGDIAPKVVFELDNDKIAVSPDGGVFSVTVRSNEAWVLNWSEGSEWCVPSVTEGEANMEGVKVMFSVDWSYEGREANFWFKTASGISHNLIVTQKAKAVILPNENNEFVISANGGVARIEFDATYPCEVVIADDAKSWVKQVVDEAADSRALESYVIDLNVLANTLYDDRETTVKVVVAGSESVYAEYTIKQAQKDAILPGVDNTFNVSADGDIVQIMFETNIAWEVVISDEGKEWIVMPEATRALREECVELEILANETYSERSATLRVVGVEDDTLYAEYTVNQAQRDAVIAGEDNNFIVAPQGGDIEISFDANVDCEVIIPEDVDWISFVTTEPSRALQLRYVVLTIAENDTYGEREAVVRVEQTGNSDLYVEYVILQRQNDALLEDSDLLIEVAATGSEEEIAYLTNVDCEVVIPEDVDWITLKEATRALRAESAVLVIAPNDTHDARTAVVDVVMVENREVHISYTISQAQMDAIILDGDKIEATVDGGMVDLGYKTNVECEVIIPEGCSWIYVAPATRGLEERNLSLIIEANDAFEPREEVIAITGAGINRDITVSQEGKRFDVAVTEYEVTTEATTIEVAVEANVDYDVIIAEECDWIAVADVEGNPSRSQLLLAVAENETIYERSAEVVLKHGEREYVLVVKQGADEGILNVDEEFVVDGGQTEIIVELESNFAYKVIIPEECDWVEMPVARRAKVESSTVRLLVHSNPTLLDRYVDIEITDAKKTISKTVRISQYASRLSDLFDGAANEILYVTTDGNIQKPNNASFGSPMTQNTYENGYGRITFLDAVTHLGDNVFDGCATIKQIILPTSIESIGDYAFRGCSALEDVFIPQSVKSIGVGAFKGSNIAKVEFEEGSQLESIAGQAFYGCKNLKNIVIPDGVKGLGDSAFSNCTALETVALSQSLDNLGSNVFGGCVKLEGIVIPDGVKTISDCAFLKCSNLQQVLLGEGVEEIGKSAFNGCASLQNVVFPLGVKRICDSAFFNCQSITAVLLGENTALTTIGNNAFNGCTSVGEVVIPAGVETIGTAAFSGCAGRLAVNTNIADATDATGAYYGSLFENIVVGDDVTAIGDYAFYGHSTIKNLVLGAAVERIGENAFGGCNAVETVVMPEGLKSIGKGAFNGCTAVNSVVIPASVETIGENAFVGCAGELMLNANVANGTSAATGIFNGSKFGRVVVGEAVTSIGDYAFANCATIAELNLGCGLENIGNSAFSGCNALVTVEMPVCVTTIGTGVFADCKNLNSVVLSDGIATISDSAFSGCTQLASVVAPANAVTIGAEAFNGCASLVDFVLPESVESIAERAFYGCSAINEVVMPSSVTAVGVSAYEACTSLQSVTLSEALTTISERTFAGCSALNAVALPNTITTIGKSAYEECDALLAVVIGEESQLATIASNAFFGCDALARVDIPASIVTIEEGAFNGCSNLGEVALGDALQLTTIGGKAFNGCTYVKSVVLPANVTTIGTSAFVGCGGDLVMNANIADGASATEGIFYGTKFKNVVIGEGVTSVGNYAFAGCDTIQNVVLGSSVTSLGVSAFEGCAALAEANIPAGIVTIGESAYSGCSAIKAVALGEAAQLTTIGNKAFNGCVAVESVVLPANVATIGTSAFVGCGGRLEMNANIANGANAAEGIFYGTKFSDVVIGEEVATVGDYAFADCTNLQNVTLGANVATLGKSAFEGCVALAEANIPAGIVTIGEKAYSGCSAIKTVALGEAAQLTTIGNKAFNGCVAVESVVLPANVATIGASAFVGCGGSLVMNANIADGASATQGIFYGTRFSNVALGESVTAVGDYAFAGCNTIANVALGTNVASLGRGAFKGCSALEAVAIDDASQLATLGNEVFSGCSALAEVTIPDGVVAIPESAFEGCSAIASINFGAEPQLATIGKKAFSGCGNVKTLILPESVTALGESAFEDCTSLVMAAMGVNVAQVEHRAFKGCSSLNIVYCNAVVPPMLGVEVFKGCPSTFDIYVPKDSVNKYMTTKNWSSYRTHISHME